MDIDFIKKGYSDKVETAFVELLEFCRKEEIKFRGNFEIPSTEKPKSIISGVEHLSMALRARIITMQNYIDILPAVINPEAPYEFKLRDND